MPGSSIGNTAASSGGSEASGAPSFSKVLAGEIHDKEEGSAPVQSGAMNLGTAADIPAQKPAFPLEPAASAREAAPAKHGARAGSAAGTARTDNESMASPEEDNRDSLAGILASLGGAQVPPPAPTAADARIAITRSGAREDGPEDSHTVLSRAGKEETGRADIFPWIPGYSTGGAGSAGDRGMAKTGITTGENLSPAIQMAQAAQTAQAAPALQAAHTAHAAQAKGKQGVLSGVEENTARTDKADRTDRVDRVDAVKPDAAQRNDLKFNVPGSGVADRPEKQAATLMDAGTQPLLPSLSAAPQGSFMAQPAERGFATGDIGPGTAISAMQDLQMPLGASGWDDALGQKVLWMVSNQEQVAELSLNPPDLGPLQVTLSLSNDQATATFVSQHADVRQALEAALPRLKEMMAESGINLGGATVSSGGDGSQQQGFERQNRPGSRYSAGESLAGQGNGNGMIAGTPGEKNRLVDIFA
jgi:flagellar hook-length control protein FliK